MVAVVEEGVVGGELEFGVVEAGGVLPICDVSVMVEAGAFVVKVGVLQDEGKAAIAIPEAAITACLRNCRLEKYLVRNISTVPETSLFSFFGIVLLTSHHKEF